MDIAIIGTARKENEKRVPIHPDHIADIPKEILNRLFFEKGYGMPFEMDDETINNLTGNCPCEREKLLKNHKTILIAKPVVEDLEEMQDGAVVWGWLHSVQQRSITQISIKKKLTLIAWENMYYEGKRELIHIFYRNNEMAGYCGVEHALQTAGIDGNYGPARKAAILSFGAVSRGSVYALQAHGIHNVTVYTKRPSSLIGDKIPGVLYKKISRNNFGDFEIMYPNEEKILLIDELIKADIIVNGVLQDPLNPDIFVDDSNIDAFSKFCLVIDVSCSREMGFSFACPTTFADPVKRIGNIMYYGVDHTPSLLWNSATWEISNALIPYLQYVVKGTKNKVLSDAVDIENGEIKNKEILLYQNRSAVYPYKQL